ncbi:hypothetical protein P0W64_02030 [Tsukamurella sp. 8F]|uniref:hypothetical protein n=1 Tax=unclassified Tsukamurella TaxID=2633480 RepID=UPI0023B92B32|nr:MULTISPECIES: hypothetical protein [unclassified Tsukamurella]MDF0528589.1 hypothetical protein [Tsukamurella sp. 8J]MDF0585551.1 hypothetical protein [Tsukamurella sp. 8F]
MATAEEEAGRRLSETVLRDVGQPIPHEARDYSLASYRSEFSSREAPLPVLLRYALSLVGLKHHGPREKVAWWVPFTYRGYPCELAHEKFGVRLRIVGDLSEEHADDLMAEVRQKLTLAVKTVEQLLSESAGGILDAGDVTVVNQHLQLRRAYDYFRERASNPDVVEDVRESGMSDVGEWWSILLGEEVMTLNASHDLVAAISAFLSSLEHDLVLALPFLDFDPSIDCLTKIIGARWGDKWRRVVGHSDPEAVRLRERLTEVIERWRNPYSHGGFEKGHGATVYLHTPGLGALPVGLSGIRDSPLFSFHAVSGTDIEGVFALFDEIDVYFAKAFPHAMGWIDSGLDVQFNAAFRMEVIERVGAEGSLARMIDVYANRVDRITNMDF